MLKFYSRESEELMTVGLKVDLYWYELETIQKELERINPDQVVWDKEDRSKMPPWGDNISPDIKALSDYFVTSSGKNLISVIKRALLDAIDEQVELEIKSL